MKKIISLILVLCLTLSVCAVLSSCKTDTSSNDDAEPKKTAEPNLGTNAKVTTAEQKPESGLLIPNKFLLAENGSVKDEIDLVWTENSLSFEVEGNKYLFEYDETTRTLDFKRTGDGSDTVMNDFLTFDEQGRVTSVAAVLDGVREPLMSFSYENGKMSLTHCINSDVTFPYEINANLDNNTVIAPPFDDPNTLLKFSKYGDLTGSSEQDYYIYEYDDKGNVESISYSVATFDLVYGDTAQTASWQRYPIKFILVYTLGMPLWMFAADAMCANIPR